jgi:O-antigen ligase
MVSPLPLPPVMSVLRPLAWAAVAAPTLLAFNVSPSATFLNQALALFFWGLLATALAWAAPLNRDSARVAGLALGAPALVLVVMALGAVFSTVLGTLPASLSLSALGLLAATLVVCAAGARAGAAGATLGRTVWRLLCEGLVVAGALHVLLAWVQVFLPDLADGQWVARSGLAGRTVGNLRQPNHVCTLMLLAMVAAVALTPAQPGMSRLWVWRPPHAVARGARDAQLAAARWLTVLGLAAFSWTLVATASRTALIGLLLLALWGLVDRSLAAGARRALLATPLMYGAAWGLMAWWSQAADKAFGAQQRLGESDLSASRLGIWRDSLQLLAEHPWTGVGFGEFNFAWTLTVLPNRPVAFFDHTHNLLLQWAVELGIPVAVLLTAAVLWMLWRLGKAAFGRNADNTRARVLRPLLVCLLILGVHSQLEYPLWYAYFLLPAAFWAGLGLAMARGVPPAGERSGDTVPAALTPSPRAPSAAALAREHLVWVLEHSRDWRGLAAGLLLAGGAVLAVMDYQRVVQVFSADALQPLPQRIAAGQRSWFFSHHADYAAATVAPEPAQEMDALRRAAHYLLDTRLMMAWADAHASSGDLPRARYLAARLREFRNPVSRTYFDACPTGPVPLAPVAPAAPANMPPASLLAQASEPSPGPPYQCRGSDPQVRLRWTDFR